MLKILSVPDLHCWWPNYSRTLEDGTPSRLADWRRAADALVEAAVAHRVAAALVPGDYFPNSRPSPAQVLEIVSLFKRLEDAGIPVAGCAGNHDLLGPGQPSPVDIVARFSPASDDGFNRRWGYTAPGFEILDGLNVVVLPSVKTVHTGSDPAVAAQEVAESLISIARTFVLRVNEIKPQPTVLMGHWAVSGCTLAAGNALAATEPTLSLADLQALPVQAVVMGHIHKPQVIATDPVVLHTGVFERHDFGEESTECGCYVVDLDSQETEWVPLPARKFYTVRLDLDSGEDARAKVEQTLQNISLEVNETVVRVVYKATEEQAKLIDHGVIIRALQEAGAHQVAGVFPEITRSERTREASLTESTKPLEALEKWLALRSDLSDELREKVMAAAAELMKEVA